MSLWRLFFTPQGHWRLPWRLVFTTATWLASTAALSTLLVLAWTVSGHAGLQQLASGALDMRLFGALTAVAAVATAFTLALAGRFWEPASWADWGLRFARPAAREVVLGFVVGGFMQAAMALALYLSGAATWHGFTLRTVPWAVALMASGWWLLTFALVGWYEEALLRGYLYSTLAASLRPWVAAAASAAVFALLHDDNPHFDARAGVGLFLAGLFFVYARRPRPWGLALPIGIHWGWNFFEGVVLGFPVSGLPIFRWAEVEVHGPAWWTGGAFGPEAGAVLLVGLLVGVLLLRPLRVAPTEEARS